MSSAESRPPTLQELPELRRKTENIAKVLSEQLSEHLETLRPLFAPERLFGKQAGGKVEVAGADNALAELQQSYKPFTIKPYDLPGTFDPAWLTLIGQVLSLEPWEYDIALQGKSVRMSSPVKWVLVYKSNYSLLQVKRVVAGVEPVRLDHLRQFAVNALVGQLLLARYPKLLRLFADLGWELKIESPPELKGLPLVTATSFIRSVRPPDDLIQAAIAFSGVPAFIELIDPSTAQQKVDRLSLKLQEIVA